MKRAVFVFPRMRDGSFLLHKDNDKERATYGQYIPPHKSGEASVVEL